ncbi:hypothetical protein Mal64_37100 [Pseudobythopirellula maris]|uniref:Uncharacterized protein n=1 Tax=Pseudobythopirellula maris TaxID=2527991 RepID=A0A5C5ZIB1_9BACT|nr:hypothetical protein Mal64_37100 [Pseudobythopirellula maris]
MVNTLNEAMPFKAFMLAGDMLLLERTNPDTLGARYLLLPFCEVSLVKFIDPMNQQTLEKAGFRGKLSQ